MSQRSDVTAIGRLAAGSLAPVIPMLGRSHLVRLFLVVGPLSVGVPLARLFAHLRSKINPEPVYSLLTISALFLVIKIL